MNAARVQSSRKEIDNSRQFAEADEATIRNVGNVRTAEERQQTFARRILTEKVQHSLDQMRRLRPSGPDEFRDSQLRSTPSGLRSRCGDI